MAATQEVTRNLIEWRNGNEAAIEKICRRLQRIEALSAS